MKTLKFYNTFKYCLFFVSAVALIIVGCSDNNNNYINPQEYIDAELKLLDEYYNQEMGSGRTRLDSMSSIAMDTVDHRRTSGLMLFHDEVTSQDSVGLFKEVGFRYKRYIIGRDDDGSVVEIVEGDNYYSSSPVVFTTFILNDAASAQSSVSFGLNEAIQNMREGSKATVIIPSSISSNPQGYATYKYELEITYLEH